jgi:hypothetical protein
MLFKGKKFSREGWEKSLLHLIQMSRIDYGKLTVLYSNEEMPKVYHPRILNWEDDILSFALVIQYEYLRKVESKLNSPNSIVTSINAFKRTHIPKNRYALMIFLIMKADGLKIHFNRNDPGRKELLSVLTASIQTNSIPDQINYDISYVLDNFECSPFEGEKPEASIKGLLTLAKPFNLAANKGNWKPSSGVLLKTTMKDYFENFRDKAKIYKELDEIDNLKFDHPVWKEK